MKKIEGIRSMVKYVFGRVNTVESGWCGQTYILKDSLHRISGIIRVDTLKGGRVSIKIKGRFNQEQAQELVKAMWNWLYFESGITIDAATKADVYSHRWYEKRYVARIRCDKWW